MLRILTFIFLAWIINKFFHILLSLSKRSQDMPPEKAPRKTRLKMDIQDADFEDVE
jgi:hypothetical protein